MSDQYSRHTSMGASASQAYRWPALSPFAERCLLLAFFTFMAFETVEAPLRYAFSQMGAPWLIYLRDVSMVLALLATAMQQVQQRKLQTTFIVFGLALSFHAIASFVQCPVPIAVIISMKTLLPPLFGAIFFPVLMKRTRGIGLFLLIVWLVTAIGIVADYRGVSLPWKGFSSELGDYDVVVNKRWSYYGEDRVGGFARDSVGAGMLAAFFGIYVLVFFRSVIARLVVAMATVALIYFTTSKGGIVAYLLVLLAYFLPPRKSQISAKFILALAFTAMVLAPIVLPQYAMPPASRLFSSFFDRIQNIWPNSWHNIQQHSWIFGSGFGNIGVGQQFLHVQGADTADNLFLLAYGYFGIFAIVYLALPFLAALQRRSPVDVIGRYAILMLIYIFAYGIVINILEGPIAGFLLGSAIQAVATRYLRPLQQRNDAYAVMAPTTAVSADRDSRACARGELRRT